MTSVLLNLPWLGCLGWCLWVSWKASGPVAGEIFLVPLTVWFFTGIPAGICGLVAWFDIRGSDGHVRGLWVAGLGMALAAMVPLLSAVENISGSVREAQINRGAPDRPNTESLPAPREVQHVQ